MTSLGLGDIAAFPFVEAPDKRNIQDGVRLLEELGAIATAENGHYQLTPQGRQLAQLPIDPRLARMVLEAQKSGSVREVMIITAALSIQDPRERPMDKQQASDEKHRRFADKDSDFGVRQPVGLSAGAAKSELFQPVPPPVPQRFPQLPAGARVAGYLYPAAPGGERAGAADQQHAFRLPQRAHRAADRLAVAHWPEGCGQAGIYRRAQRPFLDLPRLRPVQEAAEVDHGGRTGGNQPPVGAHRRAH